MFFYLSKLTFFFLEIGNNVMRARQKKTHVFIGNARSKSNARAHLKQRKTHSGLTSQHVPSRTSLALLTLRTLMSTSVDILCFNKHLCNQLLEVKYAFNH